MAEKVRSTLRLLNQLDHAVNLKRCFDELEELERLARIGMAVEKAFEKSINCTIEINSCCERAVKSEHQFCKIEQLLDWAENEEDK